MQHGPAMHLRSKSKERATYDVRFKRKDLIAEETYAFVFEKPEGFRFHAGQHIRMTLINPAETDSEGNSRFFTLASTPQDPDLIFAMRMRDTAFKRVLKHMNGGEKVLIEILLESPHGSFVLHEDLSKPAVFIVGGIGIVPVYSMVKDALHRKLSTRMFLFYSNRRPEDAPYLSELQELAKHNPSFTLIATMTQPEKSAQAWQGEKGIINRAMLEKYVGDLRSPIYYIAGLPDMVHAMQAILAEEGVNKEDILAEEFAGFTMDHNEEPSASSRRDQLWIGSTVLVILFMVILHIVGVSNADLTKISLRNPITYLVTVLMLFIVGFKVFALHRFKHTVRSRQRENKSFVQTILELHKPTGKQ